MKTIYLIRHGQTEFNLKGIIQGSNVDSDLNDTGRDQASRFFEAYQHVPFDKIYTSKLKRTVQSVQSFIDKGIPFEQFQGLNEISWGDQDGKATNSSMSEYYHYVANEWAIGNLDLQIGGGESPNQVLSRQKPVMEYILSQEHEKNVLICIHGRAMRILLCHLLGKPISEMDKFEHSNLCLYKLVYNNNKMVVELMNDTKHLV